MLRARVLQLYRRAVRATYRMPASTFPGKTRKNIREMIVLGALAAPDQAAALAMLEKGEKDVAILEKLVLCPDALKLFARKPRSAVRSPPGMVRVEATAAPPA